MVVGRQSFADEPLGPTATGGSSLLWCAVVGGIGSFGGGYAGSILGSKGGEFIYDVTERVADW